jgi:two-component system, OmpR family, alkaline phosphatase synthesis response regulator PhoP
MADTKNKTVLIVEDEAMILDSYAEILGNSGFKVLTGSDGAVGLEQAAANKEKIDLMLLDLMMPGVDGLVVLDSIRNNKDKYGTYPIVVLTNLSSETVIKEAFNRGATGYIMKTELQPDQLVTEVSKFLQ